MILFIYGDLKSSASSPPCAPSASVSVHTCSDLNCFEMAALNYLQDCNRECLSGNSALVSLHLFLFWSENFIWGDVVGIHAASSLQ